MSARPRDSFAMLRRFAAWLVLGVALAFAAAGTASAQPAPLCTPFGAGQGGQDHWGPCPAAPNIVVTTSNVGSIAGASDYYLHLRDTSGASAACSTDEKYLGDWIKKLGECGEFCFDFKVFKSGFPPGPVTPSFTIWGPAGLRATFVANFTVTSNDPWRQAICAPINLIQSGQNLPSGPSGEWRIAPTGNAYSVDWNTIIQGVTMIQFPIDFTSQPSEEAGYDNLCMKPGDCEVPPKVTGCLEDSKVEVKCNGDGTYTLTLNSGAFTGDEITLTSQTPGVTVTPPLQIWSASTSWTIVGATPGQTVTLTANTTQIGGGSEEDSDLCCSGEIVIVMPDCPPPKVGEVIVEKKVVNNTRADNATIAALVFPIDLTCGPPSTVNVSFGLNDGGSHTENNVPYGSLCTVTEAVGTLPPPPVDICDKGMTPVWATPVVTVAPNATIGAPVTVFTVVNELSCVKEEKPTVTVTKTCDPPVVSPVDNSVEAHCTITVTATGSPLPPTISIVDGLLGPINVPGSENQIVSMTSTENWTCPAMPIVAGATATCQLPGPDLAAAGGQSVIDVVVHFPDPGNARESENCVEAAGLDAAGSPVATAPRICVGFDICPDGSPMQNGACPQKPVSLTVLKKVDNRTEADLSGWQYPVTVSCTPSPNVSFNLADGGSNAVNVPPGASCTVSENIANVTLPPNEKACPERLVPQWSVTISPAGFAHAGDTVVVENVLECVKPEKPETGTITVVKKVTNKTEAELSGWDYPVTVACDPAPNASFNLADGGTDAVSGVPFGIDCKVEEDVSQVALPEKACPRGEEPQWSATISPAGPAHAGDTVTVENLLQCVKSEIVVPPPPSCDPKTTRLRGDSCACRYRQMTRTSPTECMCREGTHIVAGKGCVADLTCRRPQVPNSAGTACECPDGLEKRGNRCVAPLECRRPFVPNSRGTACVCGDGLEKRGNRCVEPLECRPPMVPNASGTDCVCPEGTRQRGRRCVRAERPAPDLPDLPRIPSFNSDDDDDDEPREEEPGK